MRSTKGADTVCIGPHVLEQYGSLLMVQTVVAGDDRGAEILVFAEISEERAGIDRLLILGHENELEQLRLGDRETNHTDAGFLESGREIDDLADIAVELLSRGLADFAYDLVHAVEDREDRTRRASHPVAESSGS